MCVPAVTAATTLDFQEEDASFLRGRPDDATTQPSERPVDPIDIFADGIVGFFERQGNESELAIDGELGDAGSDMVGTFGCTRSAESITALVAGHPKQVGIIQRTKHPSITPTATETGESVLRIFKILQCSLHAVSTVDPTGVSKDDSHIVERIFTRQRSGLACRLLSCFEAIK